MCPRLVGTFAQKAAAITFIFEVPSFTGGGVAQRANEPFIYLFVCVLMFCVIATGQGCCIIPCSL